MLPRALSRFHRPSTMPAHILCLLVCIGITVLATGKKSGVRRPVNAVVSIPIEQPTPEPYEAQIVTLYPARFIPAELTLPKKKFLLVVNNRAGLQTMNLSLKRVVSGEKLKEVPVPHKNLDWHGFLDLPPGDYVLTEASYPQAACRITIRPTKE